ncbi:hypothetical protein ACFFUB_02355 [Algimonas porphyrae]|uniref:Uncharacterized protein n=1 Tax=Algimonas porphyrae TaxID=1128113 RepID=A0ABQ5UYW8_9PROT|nr:hypothetical protein [Algimonas porphyrae]GLQ20401.1 hypothetical protein GCM10007854_13560 [Algimonas porphyrae]
MSTYNTRLASTGAAAAALRVVRANGLDQTFFFRDLDVNHTDFAARIRLYPDAPGVPLLTPSLSGDNITQTYAEWIADEILTPAHLPEGAALTDTETISSLTLSVTAEQMNALPRATIRSEPLDLAYAITFGPDDALLVGGTLTIIETA